jgi:hypothetical protein
VTEARRPAPPRPANSGPVDLEAKPLLIGALTRSLADAAGGRVALFTRAGVFLGEPVSPNALDRALKQAVERIKRAAPGRTVKISGGGSVELRAAVFIAYGPRATQLSLERVFVFLEDVIGAAPATAWQERSSRRRTAAAGEPE